MFERDNDLAGIAFALGASALFALEYQDATVATLMYGAVRRHMEVADTNLFMSGEPIQERLKRLVALAESPPGTLRTWTGDVDQWGRRGRQAIDEPTVRPTGRHRLTPSATPSELQCAVPSVTESD